MLEAAVVHVADRRARRTLVDGVTLSIAPGDSVALLGETGCGVDVLVRLLTGRLRRREQVRGSLMVDGLDVVGDGRPLRGVADDLDLLRTGWTPDLPARLARRLREPGLVVVPDVFGRCAEQDLLELVAAMTVPRAAALIVATGDPRVALAVADRITVMYAGCPVESGPAYRLLATPAHPYTRALIDAVATLDGPAPAPLPGTAPTASAAALQCVFAERCEHTRLTCWWDRPLPRPIAFGHTTACARHRQIDLAAPGWSAWRTDDRGTVDGRGQIRGLLVGARSEQRTGGDVLSDSTLAREKHVVGDLVVRGIGGAHRFAAWTSDECREDVMAVLASVGLPRRVAAQRARDLAVSQRIAVSVALAALRSPAHVVIDNDLIDITARPGIWAGARALAAAGCDVVVTSRRTADLVAVADTINGEPATDVADRLRLLPADRTGSVAVGVTLAPPSLLDV